MEQHQDESVASGSRADLDEQTLELETFVKLIEHLAEKFSHRSKLKLTPAFDKIKPSILLKAIIEFCLKFPINRWSDLLSSPESHQEKNEKEIGWRWVTKKAMSLAKFKKKDYLKTFAKSLHSYFMIRRLNANGNVAYGNLICTFVVKIFDLKYREKPSKQERAAHLDPYFLTGYDAMKIQESSFIKPLLLPTEYCKFFPGALPSGTITADSLLEEHTSSEAEREQEDEVREPQSSVCLDFIENTSNLSTTQLIEALNKKKEKCLSTAKCLTNQMNKVKDEIKNLDFQIGVAEKKLAQEEEERRVLAKLKASYPVEVLESSVGKMISITDKISKISELYNTPVEKLLHILWKTMKEAQLKTKKRSKSDTSSSSDEESNDDDSNDDKSDTSNNSNDSASSNPASETASGTNALINTPAQDPVITENCQTVSTEKDVVDSISPIETREKPICNETDTAVKSILWKNSSLETGNLQFDLLPEKDSPTLSSHAEKVAEKDFAGMESVAGSSHAQSDKPSRKRIHKSSRHSKESDRKHHKK